MAGSTNPITIPALNEYFAKDDPWNQDASKAHAVTVDSNNDGKVDKAEFDKFYLYMYAKGSQRTADNKPVMC